MRDRLTQITRPVVSLGLILICCSLYAHKRPQKEASSRQATLPVAKPGFDGPAELPRVYIKSSMADSPAPGRVIALKAGDNLQNALEKAKCGDTITLQAGSTFAGNYKLPAKNCDDQHWIILRTSAPDSALPPEGTRITPCYAGVSSLPGRPDFHCASTTDVMAKLVFNNKGSGPIMLQNGANHYRFLGLEITRDSPGSVIYNLISHEHDGTSNHIIADRDWLHGNPQDETTRGIGLSGATYFAVVDSFFTDFHCTAVTGVCVDSQAISGGAGDNPMGPYKIVNNFLEAGAECILFGGGPATQVPEDIEVRHNYLFRPMTWMKGQPQFMGAANGRPFIVKNLFELKNGRRVLVDGNIMENAWGGFTQRGFGILLTPKNQSSPHGNVCPDCLVTDVTIRYTLVSHVASGFQIGNGVSSTGGYPKDGGRYSIHDVVIDDIHAEDFAGIGTFAQISMSPGVTDAPPLHDVLIDHVTAFPPNSAFVLGGPLQANMRNISITNNVFAEGKAPIVTTGGGPDKNCSAQPGPKGISRVLDQCFVSLAFHHNLIVGGGGWPKENSTPKNARAVGFVDFREGNGGDYRLAANSKFKKAGSDGKDPGADIDAIEQATRGVR